MPRTTSVAIWLVLLTCTAGWPLRTAAAQRAGQHLPHATTPAAAAEAVDKLLVGEWELHLHEARATPSSGVPRHLRIHADGSFVWGAKRGRVAVVRPWYGQESRRYYEISDGVIQGVIFFDPEDGRLKLLRDTGGLLGRGTRVSVPDAGAP